MTENQLFDETIDNLLAMAILINQELTRRGSPWEVRMQLKIDPKNADDNSQKVVVYPLGNTNDQNI